jgi:hypothetical protein
MIEVIDNFLSPSYFLVLQEMTSSDSFPWNYRENVTKSNSENYTSLGDIGFDYGIIKNHGNFVIRDSKEAQMSVAALYLIMDYIECSDILKGRYDMTVYNPEKYRHSPHIDINHPDFISTILYMNDSDGETLVYEEKSFCTMDVDITKEYNVKKSIEPKANRLLVFDGHYIHTGHSPSKHKNRILLNSVYGKEFKM